MDLDSTQRNATLPSLLFDPSEEWMSAAETDEPDLAVDGLSRASVLERVLRLIGKGKAA